MPKYNYNEHDWYEIKICYYCGKTFYPEDKESFCDSLCKSMHEDYFHDMDWIQYELDWLKSFGRL